MIGRQNRMDPVSISLLVASVAIAATSTAVSVNQQNNQIAYQQEVLKQNAIAAQNKAAAEMKTRQNESLRKQAATRAQMAATGVDSTSGSFLDLVGQGAAAGEMDVLKAKHDGDSQAWALNTKINELETNKKNAWLEAGLAGAQAGVQGAMSMGAFSGAGGAAEGGSSISSADGASMTSGGSGFSGMTAMEGTVA